MSPGLLFSFYKIVIQKKQQSTRADDEQVTRQKKIERMKKEIERI